MYPLTEAAEALDLQITPIGVELESTEYENPGSNPNSRPYRVTTTEFVAHGFVAEVCGCKVSAQFKKPVSIAERKSYEDGEEWMNGNSAAFMAEVSKVWPGVAAHF